MCKYLLIFIGYIFQRIGYILQGIGQKRTGYWLYFTGYWLYFSTNYTYSILIVTILNAVEFIIYDNVLMCAQGAHQLIPNYT